MADVQFGLAVHFASRERPIARVYAETLDDLMLAEELGFEGAYVQEHHFAETQWCPSPLVAAAAIAARTQRLRVGTAMLLLPLYHPLRLAEDAAVVDAVSGGRLTLGVAQGYRATEFEGLGISPAERGARFEEGVDLLRACWTCDEVAYRGQFFGYEGIAVTPRPVQRPHPPLWIGAVSGAGIRRAARLGLPYCQGNTIPLPTLVERRRFYETLLPGGAAHPAASVRPLLRECYVAEDDEQAWREVAPYLVGMYRAYGDWGFEDQRSRVAQVAGGDLAIDAARAFFRDRVIIGDPERCASEIARYVAALGVTHLILRVHVPGLPAERVRRVLRLFACEVAPRVEGVAASASSGETRYPRRELA